MGVKRPFVSRRFQLFKNKAWKYVSSSFNIKTSIQTMPTKNHKPSDSVCLSRFCPCYRNAPMSECVLTQAASWGQTCFNYTYRQAKSRMISETIVFSFLILSSRLLQGLFMSGRLSLHWHESQINTASPHFITHSLLPYRFSFFHPLLEGTWCLCLCQLLLVPAPNLIHLARQWDKHI